MNSNHPVSFWKELAKIPIGCKKLAKTPQAVNIKTHLPKPSLWNITQFMQFQHLEFVSMGYWKEESDFRVFDDFKNTVKVNNVTKWVDTSYVVGSRYETGVRVLIDSALECLSRATGICVEPEVNISNNPMFPMSRVDFAIYEHGAQPPQSPLGIVEVKNGSGDFEQGLGQLFVYLIQLPLPAFGVLTDGFRFVFVKCDPDNGGRCQVVGEMIHLRSEGAMKVIFETWAALIQELRDIHEKKKGKTYHHPAFERICRNFDLQLWQCLQTRHYYAFCP